MNRILFFLISVIFSMNPFDLVLGKDSIAPTPQIGDLLEIEHQVHSFYNDAWSDLMIFISISLFVIGVVMPLLVTYLQNNNFKLQNKEMKEKIEEYKKDIFDDAKKVIHEDVEKEMEKSSAAFEKSLSENTRNLFDGLKKELLSDFDREIKKTFETGQKQLEEKVNEFIDSKIKQVRNDITKEINNGEGRIFHVQANLSSSQGDHGAALVSLIVAMGYYCKAQDFGNFKICLDMLKDRTNAAKSKFDSETAKKVKNLLKTINLPDTPQEFKDVVEVIESCGLPSK